MTRIRPTIALAAAASLLASCAATVDEIVQIDDAGADAGLLDPADAGADAGLVAPEDAGADASLVDAEDAGIDAGLLDPADAGSIPDAGTDAGASNGVVGPRLSTFVPSGPLTLVAGQEISGLHVTTTSGPCIRVSDATGVWIHDCRIGPCGPDESGVGVSVENSSDVHVDHNLATRIRGPMPRGQLVQFNGVHGAGHRIVCNVSDQTTPGYLDGPEDHVNIFSSGGTANSPILIAFNKIRGGGPSVSGGGLLAGDNDSEFVDLTDNVLVSPGQYGVAIAGGRNFRVLRNRVYAPQAYAWSNIGLYVWNQTQGSECSGHEVSGNRVFYLGPDGQNPAWDGGNCGVILGWDTENIWGDATLGPDIWDEVFAECL